MRFVHLMAALILLMSAISQAQEVRYVSDRQLVPLRSGAGNQYRITHRGLPSGTRLTVTDASSDGVWSRITTDRGTTGWIRTQYLMREIPARNQLRNALSRAEQAQQKVATLTAELKTAREKNKGLVQKIDSAEANGSDLSKQLSELQTISGNAVQLDSDNRRLLKETESLRAELGMLDSENRRLQDKLKSGEFIDGALAVLLGVVITLLVPRLWPKRRRSSGWA